MKHIFLFFTSFFLFNTPNWHHNLEEAKQVAQKEHKYILLNFSGSDWCGPCIRMHKEVFDSDTFINFSAAHLVLVNADFPRLRKNQLEKKQQEINDALADKYNPTGKFPYTVLLSEDGKPVKDWEGFTGAKPEAFCNTLAALMEAK